MANDKRTKEDKQHTYTHGECKTLNENANFKTHTQTKSDKAGNKTNASSTAGETELLMWLSCTALFTCKMCQLLLKCLHGGNFGDERNKQSVEHSNGSKN